MSSTLDIDDLLVKTSRTFALAIPLLPEPTRKTVSLAYLMFRIADTLEDATEWARPERVASLGAFAEALTDLDDARAVELRDCWMKTPPCSHAGYLELLDAMPRVFAQVRALPSTSRAIVVDHARRTAEGMAKIVTKGTERGGIDLASVDELRAYCYVVAGIVGELLTQLFVHDAPRLEEVRTELEGAMVAFGEGLQLVNILKDERDDAGDGRSYMPKNIPRVEIFALAREDGRAQERYIDALRRARAPGGFIAFTSLCASLASASLDRIEKSGAGSKLTRPDVMSILGAVRARVMRTSS